MDAINEGRDCFSFSGYHIKPGRFLGIEKQLLANETFTLDFNKAYNPPCAFSTFMTCPPLSNQNVLTTRIEDGEKYRERR